VLKKALQARSCERCAVEQFPATAVLAAMFIPLGSSAAFGINPQPRHHVAVEVCDDLQNWANCYSVGPELTSRFPLWIAAMNAAVGLQSAAKSPG
jgi:hypothetical protein